MDNTHFITIEPFYYGNRLKGLIKVIENRQDHDRMYIGQLFTHGKQLVGQKVFFKIGADYTEQNDLYNKCHDYVQNYLNTCKY
jgi:hypothetical protein